MRRTNRKAEHEKIESHTRTAKQTIITNAQSLYGLRRTQKKTNEVETSPLQIGFGIIRYCVCVCTVEAEHELIAYCLCHIFIIFIYIYLHIESLNKFNGLLFARASCNQRFTQHGTQWLWQRHHQRNDTYRFTHAIEWDRQLLHTKWVNENKRHKNYRPREQLKSFWWVCTWLVTELMRPYEAVRQTRSYRLIDSSSRVMCSFKFCGQTIVVRCEVWKNVIFGVFISHSVDR